MRTRIRDIGLKADEKLANLTDVDLMQLPAPYEEWGQGWSIKPLTEEQSAEYECSLDGVVAAGIRKPRSKEEEDELVGKFLQGLKKLLSKESNWTFVKALKLSLDYCLNCQTCSEACPIYLGSGEQEIYRPTYRSEVLRRIVHKYLHKQGRFRSWFSGNDVELNWATIARLAELSYRCTICRRCAQRCPIGIDNGLMTRELRKLFSQEMGIAPNELHEDGTVQQLNVGASTGMAPKAFNGIVQFMEEEIEDKTGKKIKIPVDKEGADILFIHNSGEFMSWPENPEAFAIIFEEAGLSWTMSSELGGYEATNYGLFYDDVQFARIVMKQIEVARKLGVNRIVIGECGHAHKLAVTADRLLAGEAHIPRESYLPLLEDLVVNDKLRLDPKKNDFPVTLHDPCNVVRLMGIVEPQRRILRKICPQFREMEPHGVDNYCCGGGSGFAIMNSLNFQDWRCNISGRMKFKQFVDVFQDMMSPEIRKYVCAPCSNCKGQFRDLLSYYNAWQQHGIFYGGLVELVVNAMADIEEPFIEWEWR